MVSILRGVGLMRMLRRLLRDRRGAVAMLAGLSIIPLLTMAGAAVDLTRVYILHWRLVRPRSMPRRSPARA